MRKENRAKEKFRVNLAMCYANPCAVEIKEFSTSWRAWFSCFVERQKYDSTTNLFDGKSIFQCTFLIFYICISFSHYGQNHFSSNFSSVKNMEQRCQINFNASS